MWYNNGNPMTEMGVVTSMFDMVAFLIVPCMLLLDPESSTSAWSGDGMIAVGARRFLKISKIILEFLLATLETVLFLLSLGLTTQTHDR
jgi:hypothetical protein